LNLCLHEPQARDLAFGSSKCEILVASLRSGPRDG
jgi:hypothetical protein